MSLPRIFSIALAVAALGPAPAAAGAPSSEVLVAPFTCDSEWRGTTYGGHGSNNWNLDLNRTSRTYDDRDHDLDQPTLAQGDGTVVWVAQDGYNSGAGAYVEVDYGDVTVVYVHLVENSIPVEVGDAIDVGQLLGLLGGTGNASHPHLHLEYWDSAEYDDARRWELPAANHLPIEFAGIAHIATPGTPTDNFVSTNCVGDSYPFDDVPLGSIARDDIALLFDLEITTGTGDGKYSPSMLVTREQMAAFLARLWRLLDGGTTELPADLAIPFDDVASGSYARDDIALLAHLRITTGTGIGTYSPWVEVTREQMAAFLARLWRHLDDGTTELPEELVDPFDDVADTSYAHDDILLLSRLGVTSGIEPSRYGPDEVVDREQMAAFLARLHRLFG